MAIPVLKYNTPVTTQGVGIVCMFLRKLKSVPDDVRSCTLCVVVTDVNIQNTGEGGEKH
jgi:hypothetical protein